MVIGGTASAYYLHLHRWAGAIKLSDLQSAPPLVTERRILVISPHCDDETLGAGEMIADARSAGIPVTVAFLTNGDGFAVAAGRELHEVSISHGDFVRFAEVRQRESLSALKELGVDAKSIQFLGYPDQGLKPMWESNWSPDDPYRSRYTGLTRCPYARSYTPQALYCGQNLLNDLERLIATVRPTDIYVTHPSDDHPDHCLAATFTEAALRICRENPSMASWAGSSQIHYYIVHRGDWPLPQGYHPTRPLLPPPGLAALDTRWMVYRASTDAIHAKRRALERYVSQTSIEGRFLRSFLRPNEIFGDMPTENLRTASRTTDATSLADRYTSMIAMAKDPVGDDLIRYTTPSADLTGIYVRTLPEKHALQIGISVDNAVSRRVHYTLLVRALDGEHSTFPFDATQSLTNSHFLTLNLTPTSADIRAHAKTLQTTIPLEDLGMTGDAPSGYIWVSAETRLNARLSSRLPAIDRTGYRAFRLEGATVFPALPATLASAKGSDGNAAAPFTPNLFPTSAE